MPGFAISGQDAAHAGQQVPRGAIEVRRTHRWAFTAMNGLGADVLIVLKSASRPSLSFEDPTMFHDQERIHLAGQHTWEPITLTWYDVEQSPDCSDAIYKWLNQEGGGKSGPINLQRMVLNKPQDYKGEADLIMTQADGSQSEAWHFYNGWPKVVNWNGLDYASTELQLIEVQYRYDRAVKKAGSAG